MISQTVKVLKPYRNGGMVLSKMQAPRMSKTTPSFFSVTNLTERESDRSLLPRDKSGPGHITTFYSLKHLRRRDIA